MNLFDLALDSYDPAAASRALFGDPLQNVANGEESAVASASAAAASAANLNEDPASSPAVDAALANNPWDVFMLREDLPRLPPLPELPELPELENWEKDILFFTESLLPPPPPVDANHHQYFDVGTRVEKIFVVPDARNTMKLYSGEVVGFDAENGWYSVVFEGGYDGGEYNYDEILAILAD
mmetsp:Transcript_34825/g.76205  ORF Transcript_34825/g.76205 Transcript_34825/m.76205 type:complete len:182 (+) Transcript_34825:410-955(+)|eukprot:CAMPEP_0178507370 /NCGR_PEP_ID=MMETSP0696-20121128/20180_1 /TAXON_ID=265572 /ORGANISM="Extubocellulus spinifer, Strain CCMP396" /LENGTH=181 /DNA_ID=CAMNT_0020136847 /DNA_START=405 /DNA_END=950 /DNA_ORIENTATION=-